MYKKTVYAFSVCLLSLVANAQTSDIELVLREIEQNNKELLAYSDLMKSRQLELKSGNNLPDPQAEAYYLPWGNHITGDYTEFQVTQSFEFPTVYGARKNLIEKQNEQMQLAYNSLRQEVLLPAKKYMLEIVYLNKNVTVEQKRVQQAKQVFNQVQELFDKGQVGILEVNKAKIAWIQEQFNVEQIESDKRNVLLLLQNLNGGNKITFNRTDFAEKLNLATLDSIWSQRQLVDPTIKMLKQQEIVAHQQIKLSKSQSLPTLTAGFNYQGVSGFNYSGIYGGTSIPLWNNRHKVKAAEARYQYRQSYANAELMLVYVDFQKQYNEYQILISKFQEYQSTLSGLNSDALLLKTYELGEISFMEYYLELQFYRQAYDAMLQMENELHKLKSEILKHQL